MFHINAKSDTNVQFRIPAKARSMVYQYHRNINNAFLEGVSTAEPHETPETSTTLSVGHGLF